MGEVIGILSLKGGVGKTSVTTELGVALGAIGKKVLLIDGNFSAPNLGLHLNVVNPETTIHDVLGRTANVKEAIYGSDLFDVIFASMYSKNEINTLKLKDAIKPLKSKYDFIIIDSSPALNEETLAVMLASDKLFVVTTPDYVTLGTTLKAIKSAKKRGTPIHGIILNRVLNKKFELSVKDIESVADVPVLAVVPYNIKMIEALSKFVPYSVYRPKAEGVQEFRKLACALTGEKYKSAKIKNLLRKVLPKRQDINRTIFSESKY